MTPIAFIGGGNMTRAMVAGLRKSGLANEDIRVAEPQMDVCEALARELGVVSFTDNTKAVADTGIVVLAVKPQVVPEICRDLRTHFKHQRPLLISIAAGVNLAQLERWLGPVPMVRCMPNTPALLGVSATALCANVQVSAAQRMQVQSLLSAIGFTCWIDNEACMNTVTSLSGSGPAYFFALVEALIDAAVAQGLPCDTAHALAVHTCLGAGRMLVESGKTPTELRCQVTSPGGTTQAALASLKTSHLSHIVAQAFAAASRRGDELATALDKVLSP